MAYILKNNPDQLFYLDYSSRNGLYYKYFSASKNNRIMSLSQQSTLNYAATLDSNHQIHVACKNRQNQIVHYKQSKVGFTNEVILDDPDNTYNISNFRLITCKDELFLFYTAKNPNEKTADIIQHQLNNDDTPPQSVIPVENLTSHYDCLLFNDDIYLLSINREANNEYELQLSVYEKEKEDWEYYATLASSTHPITHCSMCVDSHNQLHCIYTQNQYGRYTTSYTSIGKDSDDNKQIHTCPYDIQPVIFSYNDTLWINWKENKGLYMQMSTNQGQTFTDTQSCSLQDPNMQIYHYIYDQDLHPSLKGHNFYGVTELYPKFAILNQLDMDHIHIQNRPNKELKLFMTQLNDIYKNSNSNDYKRLLKENRELKHLQDQMITQYEELSDMAKRLQNEGKKWRSKYYSAQVELKGKNEHANVQPKETPKQEIEPLNVNLVSTDDIDGPGPINM